MIRLMLLAGAALALTAAPALAQPAPSARPEDVGMSSRQLGLISDALRLHIATRQIAGGIVYVAREGKVVHLEAQGVTTVNGQAPMRTDTIFAIASLSKPVTGVAVLMLVDEGKISLDDPVGKYIPEFGRPRQVRVLEPGSPPPAFTPLPGVQPVQSEFGPARYRLAAARNVMTVRMLLNHTSGIQIFGVPNDPATRPEGPNTLAARIPPMADLPLEFEPGSRWAYSNGAGFDVLGRVVEVASGMPFDQFLKTRLWGPLGMNDTNFGVEASNAARAVGMFPNAPIAAADKTTFFSGAAGMWSSVSDYAKFVQMLVDGGTANGRRFLKPETVALLSSNQIGPLIMGGYPPMALPPEGLKFGLGVLTVTNPAAAGTQVPAGSFGWDGVGSRRWWALRDQKIVIVMMAPLIGPGAAPFHRDVESAVMSSLAAR